MKKTFTIFYLIIYLICFSTNANAFINRPIKTEIEKFQHIKSFPIPPHLRNDTKVSLSTNF